MDNKKLNMDKVHRLINLLRSDLDRKHRKERELLSNDLSTKGAYGSGPGNHQQIELYEIQLRELGDVIVECYLESFEKNIPIDDSIKIKVIQQINSTLDNQSDALKSKMKSAMTSIGVPKGVIETTLADLRTAIAMAKKYCEDKLIVEITEINENLE